MYKSCYIIIHVEFFEPIRYGFCPPSPPSPPPDDKQVQYDVLQFRNQLRFYANPSNELELMTALVARELWLMFYSVKVIAGDLLYVCSCSLLFDPVRCDVSASEENHSADVR